MIKNMGAADKTIRIILGIIIIGGGFYYKSWWGLVGLIPLLTAFISWCPLYAPFGISTCRKK
ncbi:YgaP family membrane protein [Saccharicrinis sp. GN24d3]|uniref:YgaP family membrane protein n=1 Tax=Saccharicrinis sp. GN24d3 TaxID=3458416 RepID=UPI004036DAF6